jgi:hypothetical protein
MSGDYYTYGTHPVFSDGDIWSQTWQSGLKGGLAAFASYGLSDAYKWNTHEKVLNWAEARGITETAGAKYICGIANIPYDKYEFDKNYYDSMGQYNYATGKIKLGPLSKYNEKFEFDASNFYKTVWHEGQHLLLGKSPGVRWIKMPESVFRMILKEHHKIIYSNQLSHKYFGFWSPFVREITARRYVKSTLELYY